MICLSLKRGQEGLAQILEDAAGGPEEEKEEIEEWIDEVIEQIEEEVVE